jgi:hypothetical protein
VAAAQKAKTKAKAQRPRKNNTAGYTRYTRSPNVDPSCPLDSILLQIADNPRADRTSREWAERLLSTEATKVVFVASVRKQPLFKE